MDLIIASIVSFIIGGGFGVMCSALIMADREEDDQHGHDQDP